jgi:two-component system, NarL family, capsular synthesis sensor histidine kinase RcsC
MLDCDILIPRPNDKLQPANSRSVSNDRPQKRARALRVLVVDDDFAIKVLVTAMLEVLDCLVDRADNGAQALDSMASRRYDLVLTDLHMPVMDGYSLACTVRTHRPDTKIVIMTGTSKDEVEAMTGAGQVDAWLFKPFGLREVRHLIDRFESL